MWEDRTMEVEEREKRCGETMRGRLIGGRRDSKSALACTRES